MKIIVTGHRGYIGTVLVPLLVNKGHTVKGIDIGLYESFEFPHDQPKIEEIRKDIRAITVNDLKGYDAVIHLAALSNDPIGELNPGITEAINYKASVQIAELSKKAGIRRFVFSSSCSVYGKVEDEHILYETDPVSPITEYAKSKVKTELDVAKLADKDFCPVFMRNATVYGYSPSLRLDLVVNNLTAWAFYTNKINIMSDGKPWRPLIHVDDLSNIFEMITTAPREKVSNEIFNVGFSDENYQVKGIAEVIQKLIPGTEISIGMNFDPDSRSYNVNFDKLNKIIKPKRQWNVVKGAKEIYEMFKKVPLNRDQFEKKACQRLFQLKAVKDKFPNFF